MLLQDEVKALSLAGEQMLAILRHAAWTLRSWTLRSSPQSFREAS